MILTASKLNVCTETLTYIEKLNNYALSVPFLSSIFTLPTEDKTIDSKVLYDQAKHKNPVMLEYNSVSDGEIANPVYVYTREQFMEEWLRDNNSPICSTVDHLDTLSKV